MYSRSYGSIEAERKNDGISIPANYNGSLYPAGMQTEQEKKKTESSPEKKEAQTVRDVPQIPVSDPQEPPKRHTSGAIGGLLEKFTAEDMILFVLVFSLMKEESEDPGTILAVILALLLI